MASIKTKRSVHPKQLTKDVPCSKRRTNNHKFIHFLEIQGKVVEDVQFFSDPSYNTLELRFQDHTALSIDIGPSFTLEAYLSTWKSGNQRVLRRWTPIRSS